MRNIYTSADQLIGNTPLLELTHLEQAEGLEATVLAKLEYFNPGGSVKDRVGKAMIEDAEQKGLLKPGATIGMHTHETSSEVIYILSGVGKVLCEGVYEPLAPGACHYCPKGTAHSLINDSDGDLEFLAIVPEQ